ncbi:unnamed protein product [Rotaria sp. Silwood2]|nr:unnamed protein product [Rotaria sp. Silwood2]CAF4417419.1 unnamed protein product [Rotaria sp. Silwood2]
MLTITTIPDDVLAETINTIADIIHGNAENQQFLSSFINTTTEDKHLLNKMTNDKKKSFRLRISILYCLQCYLHKNDFGKSMIVETLLPQNETAANQCTFGHLLIIGYLSKDIVTSWCSSIALAHLIADDEKYKKAILKVILTFDQSQTDVKTLMEISLNLLQNTSSSFRSRVGVLIFLCTWLSNCSLAVQTFLSIDNSVPYLVSQICAESVTDNHELLIQSLCSFALGLCLIFNNNQVESYSTESLKRLIYNRMGADLFEEKLRVLSKFECYLEALQKPQLILSKSSDLILDYEFARLHQTLESSISCIILRQDINSIIQTSIDSMPINLYVQQTSTTITHSDDFMQERFKQINIHEKDEKQLMQNCDLDKTKILPFAQQIQEIKGTQAL